MVQNLNTTTPDSNNRFISIFGQNLGSTMGFRFSRIQLSNIKLSSYAKSVIIGILLSDGWTQITSGSKNATFFFEQSLAHFPYIWQVFNILSHYCPSFLKFKIRIEKKVNRKNTFSLFFYSRAMPCITEIHNLFYSSGKKILPNNIFELLDPIALAHWICGDGKARTHGLMLNTESFSLIEVVKLINVLIIKYNLECTLRKVREDQYAIYIRQNSMKLLIKLVKPYIDPSMLYKIIPKK